MSFVLMNSFCRLSITVLTLMVIFIQTREPKKERKLKDHLQAETCIEKQPVRKLTLKSLGKKELLIE